MTKYVLYYDGEEIYDADNLTAIRKYMRERYDETVEYELEELTRYPNPYQSEDDLRISVREQLLELYTIMQEITMVDF